MCLTYFYFFVRQIERAKSAGRNWFDMPAPEMTQELQRDLNILRMRHVLDPKRHYKKNSSKKLPKYFQVVNNFLVLDYCMWAGAFHDSCNEIIYDYEIIMKYRL